MTARQGDDGSYRSAAEQATPTIIDVRGVKVASLSYTSGFNGLLRPPGKQWLTNRVDPTVILAEARRTRSGPTGDAHDERWEDG